MQNRLNSVFDDYNKSCQEQKSSLNKNYDRILKIVLYFLVLINVASFTILFVNYYLITYLISGKLNFFGKNSVTPWFSGAFVVFVISFILLVFLSCLSAVKSRDSKFLKNYCKFADSTQEVINKLKEDFLAQSQTIASLLERCSKLEDNCKNLLSKYEVIRDEIKTRIEKLYSDCNARVQSVAGRVYALDNIAREIVVKLDILGTDYNKFASKLNEFLDEIDNVIKLDTIDLNLKIDLLERMGKDFSAGVDISYVKRLVGDVIKEISEKVAEPKGKFFSRSSVNKEIHNFCARLKDFSESEIDESNASVHVKNLKDYTSQFMSVNGCKDISKECSDKSKEEVKDLCYVMYLIFFLDLTLSRFLVKEHSDMLINFCKDTREFLSANVSGNVSDREDFPNPDDLLKEVIDLLDGLSSLEEQEATSTNPDTDVSSEAASTASVPSSNDFVISDMPVGVATTGPSGLGGPTDDVSRT